MLDEMGASAELCAQRLPALRVLRLAHNRLKFIPAGVAGLTSSKCLGTFVLSSSQMRE